MRGTVTQVNTAMSKPLLYLGVEQKLLGANAFICGLLIMSTHMRMPACFFGVVVFMIIHALLRPLAQHDPNFAMIVKRYTRYCRQDYFPSISHPNQTSVWEVKTVARP